MEKPNIIHCSYLDEASLYLAYMPFIKGGGLFIRTNPNYSLEEIVKLSVTLLNEPDPYLIEGKVVWITPKGTQGNKYSGIGVQCLGENSRYLSNKIETYIAGTLKSSHSTDTI
jgi:type IV pilus assembly protein PilZ